MLGALIGDIVGSVYEQMSTKQTGFPLFTPRSRITDDSVMTVAVAEVLLTSGDPRSMPFPSSKYAASLRRWGRAYPDAGYGGSFKKWLSDENEGPYNSWGNGSAMRVSPVGWAGTTVEEVLHEAELTALPTHNHPEGIKGAQAVALAVFLARTEASRETIKESLSRKFNYDLSRSIRDIRPSYEFDVSCQGSVPEAIIAFLDSENFEEAIRNAISLGGDADTQAAIAGAVAEAFYGGVPEKFLAFAVPRLPADILEVATRFAEKYLKPDTVSALIEEKKLCGEEHFDDRYPRPERYSILMHGETWGRIKTLAAKIDGKYTTPGAFLQESLGNLQPVKLNGELLLNSLMQTKVPCIFAESAVRGDGTDWSREELSLLGDISVAVPVMIFDDGKHESPQVHDEPFSGTLVYTPGALLAGGGDERPADWHVIRNDAVNPEAYNALYERRLLPVLKYAGAAAGRNRRKALITIPGLGCGRFAGRFRGTLQTLFRDALISILEKYRDELPGIRTIWYDPYRACPAERREIGNISLLVRPYTGAAGEIPGLCPPERYEEEGDDYSNCELFSVVAWDHASWPGNDFFLGSRSTDDGVKAAATDSMFRLTGLRGRYEGTSNQYLPPRDYVNWNEVVQESRMILKAAGNVVIVGNDVSHSAREHFRI